MPPIATYVFFNAGTTGLIQHFNKIPEITELHMTAITSEELRRYFKDGGEENFADLPDVSNLHCRLEDDVMWCLGEECILKDEIVGFLNRLKKPVCLIAYNGSKFFFPVLAKQLADADMFSTEGVLCADSMAAFYDILEPGSEKTSYYSRAFCQSFPWPVQANKNSYRFEDVCKRELGFHRFPNKVEFRNKAMMQIALGMSYEFMLWVAENNYPFAGVMAQYNNEEEDEIISMFR